MRNVQVKVQEIGDREPDSQDIHLWDRWLRGDVENCSPGIELDAMEGQDSDDRQGNGGKESRPSRCPPASQPGSYKAQVRARLRRTL